MSSLAWIDFDEAERQRALRIMALLDEREGRDELGLGSIRDSIADHLFPGTSTIQTRLRYMLFVPWIMRMLESRDLAEGQLRSEARELEIRLADALKAGGEQYGIIGRDAGARLQRLPSSVYWSGLGAWRIRNFPGSADSLFASLPARKRGRLPVDPDELAQSAAVDAVWVRTLPEAPADLLQKTTFHLTAEEAQFIVDRLVNAQAGSLIAFLAREAMEVDCDYIWAHPRLAEFPEFARRLVRHGEIFSQIMHGAALLYNLTLSELRGRDDWADEYRRRIAAWSEEIGPTLARGWSLGEFWDAVKHPGHSIKPPARRFVTEWLELVADGTPQIATLPAARLLVEMRERQLKTTQSRYVNRSVRDRWSGASGVNRLTFRWNQTRSHLKDLIDAR
ncbi:hypothetical protein FDV58_17900 [Bradyrhizobium elkanii]|uniref:Uncharacterized protein n=1 Tax=Bradyrhizobium elkanii TaxID=29448 RepID=A0A4U6S2A0_BRAEL|nr:DUF6361 family protein [Bradyrhizobium elkanii]TKV80122.1 hypothetical protein FDV58_17900 [Bradyrhizobium elkanii]